MTTPAEATATARREAAQRGHTLNATVEGPRKAVAACTTCDAKVIVDLRTANATGSALFYDCTPRCTRRSP